MSKMFGNTMRNFSKGQLKTKRGRTVKDRSEAFRHACEAKKQERAQSKGALDPLRRR